MISEDALHQILGEEREGGGGSKQQDRAPVLLCDKRIEKVF